MTEEDFSKWENEPLNMKAFTVFQAVLWTLQMLTSSLLL